MTQEYKGEMVQLPVADTYFDAYIARPPARAKGGVVVIQEIFGVNDDIKSIADWLASEGYIALAPDLFWRQTRNIAFTDPSDDEMQQAFDLMGSYDADLGVGDIQTTIDYLRAEGVAKVGTIGFCLGGRMVYLAACRTDGNAHASYYGVGIQDALDEATSMTAPTLLHIAGNDEFVPKPAQDAIVHGFTGHAFAQTHIYAGKDHGFARNSGMHHDDEAATLAHQRTLALFEANLQ